MFDDCAAVAACDAALTALASEQWVQARHICILWEREVDMFFHCLVNFEQSGQAPITCYIKTLPFA